MKKIIIVFLVPMTCFAQGTIERCLSLEDQQAQSTVAIMKYQYCKDHPNTKGCSDQQTEKLLQNVTKQVHKSNSNLPELEKCNPILYP